MVRCWEPLFTCLKNSSKNNVKVAWYWNKNLRLLISLISRLFCSKGWSNYTVSEGKVFFLNLAMTERNMQVKFDLKLSVYSLGLNIWPLSFEFDFSLMGWPPQPPRERVPKINKIVSFWFQKFHKKISSKTHYFIEFWHPFSWRLLRPSHETKIKFKG